MTDTTANPFNTYMNMVTALAVTVGLVTSYFRDRRLARGTAQVATAAKEAATIVGEVKNTVEATHTIVNSQRTAIMQKLADSQLFTLTLAQSILAMHPEDEMLKGAVLRAQALYDASLHDLKIKKQEL